MGNYNLDPHRLAISPTHFAEHLDVIRELGTPLSLRELVGDLRSGRRTAKGIVVTFDDGYVDNVTTALPLLERHDIPATIFVATEPIAAGAEFAWDELAHIVFGSPELPRTVTLTIHGETLRLETADRVALHNTLHPWLQILRPSERDGLLQRLRDWAGFSGGPRETHRALKRSELEKLGRHDLIDIGAHTVTHPLLQRLTPEHQAQEIRTSKRHLEDILGRAVEGFAYPYGGRNDYGEESVAAVKAAGFTSACANWYASVYPGVDLYQLPRLSVPACDGEEFRRHLRWFALG